MPSPKTKFIGYRGIHSDGFEVTDGTGWWWVPDITNGWEDRIRLLLPSKVITPCAVPKSLGLPKD